MIDGSSGRDDSQYVEEQVDYSALCRYIVRMGRASKSMQEEKKALEDNKYRQLKALLKTELINR